MQYRCWLKSAASAKPDAASFLIPTFVLKGNLIFRKLLIELIEVRISR